MGKRILYGLLWIGWAGFWTQIAHEWLSWPVWLCWTALLILPFVYSIKVTNWWMATSGWISFVVFGVAGVIGMWAWSAVSPMMDYKPSSIMQWQIVALFWGYIGVAIAKTYMTLEAIFHPENFQAAMLDCFKKGWDWQWWTRANRADVKCGLIPREIAEKPTRPADDDDWGPDD